jgi:hypothetical protein
MELRSMPITIKVTYPTYAELLKKGELSLDGAACADADCRAASGGEPLVLTKSVVGRGVIVLERDHYGVLHGRRIVATIVRARCRRCGSRPRVLPCDVLPYKRYSTPIVERHMTCYGGGGISLRRTVLGVFVQPDDAIVAHTTLHGWTEGCGAHALDRPGSRTDGLPVSRFIAEASARDPRIEELRRQEIEVDPRRYRSEARRERLAAMAMLLLVAAAVAVVRSPDALSTCRRLALLWSRSCALAFPSRLPCPPIELSGSSRPASFRLPQVQESDSCRHHDETPSRSPPRASS